MRLQNLISVFILNNLVKMWINYCIFVHKQFGSSVGRAVVSKTIGRRFESFPSCTHKPDREKRDGRKLKEVFRGLTVNSLGY